MTHDENFAKRAVEYFAGTRGGMFRALFKGDDTQKKMLTEEAENSPQNVADGHDRLSLLEGGVSDKGLVGGGLVADGIVRHKNILLESGRLLQVGALVYRYEEGDLRFLLITSRGTGRWIIPKGWPMPGRSLAKAALREAYEEAGIRGTLDRTSCGCYDYEKHDMAVGTNNRFTVEVYGVAYTQQKKKWPEQAERSFLWVSKEEAIKKLREKGLKKILKNFHLNCQNT